MPLLGVVYRPWARTSYDQPTYKLEVSVFTHHEDMKT